MELEAVVDSPEEVAKEVAAKGVVAGVGEGAAAKEEAATAGRFPKTGTSDHPVACPAHADVVQARAGLLPLPRDSHTNSSACWELHQDWRWRQAF